MARRYVGVLLEYGSIVNPEPGVMRAPTADEQTRALDRLARRLDGTLDATVTVRQGHGLAGDAIDALADHRPFGLLMFSVDALRRGDHVDAAVLRALWRLTGEIGLLIEDEHLTNDDEFEEYMIMVVTVNHVRARDASSWWADFVHGPELR